MLYDVGVAYSVMVPVFGSIDPIWLADCSVNHSMPSGPAVMSPGLLPAVGIGYAFTVPVVGSTDRITLSTPSVNHASPSGPSVTLVTGISESKRENSMIRLVAGLNCPTRFASVNQSKPFVPLASIAGAADDGITM